MKPTMPKQARRLRGLRESEPNGVVEVVELGTDHRLSLAQNPVLLAGQIEILLASCNRDLARLRKRRQVAGREEVRAGDSESRAQFGRTPRAVRQLFQDVVRRRGEAAPFVFVRPADHLRLDRIAVDAARHRILTFESSGNVRPARWSFDTKPTPIESKSFTHQIILQSA